MKGSKVVKARGLPWSATAEEVSKKSIENPNLTIVTCTRWLNFSSPLWLLAEKMGFTLRLTGFSFCLITAATSEDDLDFSKGGKA